VSWFSDWLGITAGLWFGAIDEETVTPEIASGYAVMPVRRPMRRAIEDDEALLMCIL
jgi:hypothetical protein